MDAKCERLFDLEFFTALVTLLVILGGFVGTSYTVSKHAVQEQQLAARKSLPK